MLIFGGLADVIGRRWGSRMVACLMLSGSVLHAITPWVSSPTSYLALLVFAQTW
jgi:MFS family permease